MPRKGINGHGVYGVFSHGGAILLRNQADANLLRHVLHLANLGSPAFIGAIVDSDDAADDTAEKAEGGEGLTHRGSLDPATFLEYRANGGRRAVAADEAAGHENGEPFGYALEHRGDKNAAENKRDAVLQDFGGAVQHEGVAHLTEHLLEAALTASTQIKGGEQHGDKYAGIARGLGAEGYPIQTERPENDADEAGD